MGSRHWSVVSYSKFYTYNWLHYFSHNLPCLHLVSLIPKFITPNAALRIRRHCVLIGLCLHKMLALNKLKLKVKLWAFRCPCLCLFVILPPIPLKSSQVLLKVGLVLGKCIVTCCRYLRFPILQSPTFTAPSIFCSLYSQDHGSTSCSVSN